jgi:type V secretory pathway adhesin AidA
LLIVHFFLPPASKSAGQDNNDSESEKPDRTTPPPEEEVKPSTNKTTAAPTKSSTSNDTAEATEKNRSSLKIKLVGPRLDDVSKLKVSREELKKFAHHFAHKLKVLYKSGYRKTVKNLKMLIKYHGDINRVMAYLDGNFK